MSPTAGDLPTGIVFASFMVCIALGGELFNVLVVNNKLRVEAVSVGVFAAAALAMAACFAVLVCGHDDRAAFDAVFAACLVLEVTVGMFYACAASLRSAYIPEDILSTTINICRLPLNMLVVVGTQLSEASHTMAFLVCACWFGM